MQHFDRRAASRIVSELELAATNLKLVRHWLSLWSDSRLPHRGTINPAGIKPLLPNLILFDVVPDKSVTVRLAGTTFNFVLGAELAGTNWIDNAPPEYRSQRLRIFSDIAMGAIGRGVRSVDMKSGEARICEEILLPFRGTGSEAQLVLCHVDWDVAFDFTMIASREQACGPALAFETIQLPLTKAA